MKTSKYVSAYVKAKDIAKPQTVTVTSVEEREFTNDGKTKTSLVVFFKELEQGVVACKEALIQLTEIFETEETDDWTGKKVTLFADPNVKYAGKRVGGLRFKQVETAGAKK